MMKIIGKHPCTHCVLNIALITFSRSPICDPHCNDGDAVVDTFLSRERSSSRLLLVRLGRVRPRNFYHPLFGNCCSQPSFIGSNPPRHAMVHVLSPPHASKTFLEIRKLPLEYCTRWRNTFDIMSPWNEDLEETSKDCWDVASEGLEKGCES